jgi:hypothetical protein
MSTTVKSIHLLCASRDHESHRQVAVVVVVVVVVGIMVARTVPLQDIARHFSVSKPSGHQEPNTRNFAQGQPAFLLIPCQVYLWYWLVFNVDSFLFLFPESSWPEYGSIKDVGEGGFIFADPRSIWLPR